MAADPVREKLCELIREHGVAICSATRTCEMLVNDAFPDRPPEAAAVLAALRIGIVRHLLVPTEDKTEAELIADLTKKLSASGEMDEATAEWTVRSWAAALHPHRHRAPDQPQSWEGEPPALKPRAGEADSLAWWRRPGVLALTLISGAGSIGGALPALVSWLGGAEGSEMALLGLAGFFGGALGGGFGWILGAGKQDPGVFIHGKFSGIAVTLAMLGAFLGAWVGGPMAAAYLGDAGALIGSTAFAMIGAYCGWLLGWMW